MNKIIKPLILVIILTLNSINSFSQDKKNSLVNSPEQSQKNIEIKFSYEQIAKLDDYLLHGQYQEFFNLIQNTQVSKKNYLDYLLSKQNEGHIPLYWLISDYYAKENNQQETHKWFYISLIMTQQDSYLCSDLTARNAPRILMKSFSTSVDVTRVSPQLIDSSMKEVIYFINNLKERIDPIWVCYYGNNGVLTGNNVLIPRSQWSNERKNVFNRFTSKFPK
ncbi:hypothetical protein GW796_07385 [archaeon]|nr:hypothetical protein [archaeon]NCQ51706.1 hypothetical protein [archaeon]